jgi:ribosome-interacting GTPase 1
MEKIKKKVENHFKLKLDEPTRRFEVVFARGCYFKIARELTKNSYQKIANTLGKNHATVMHGIKTVNDLIETDKDLRQQYDSLINKFSEYNKIEKKMTLTKLVREYNKLLFICEEKDNKIKELTETIYKFAELD